jgi:hypothetical protein
MKTTLPIAIHTIAEAKKFLKELYINDESFHPEDCAKNIIIYKTGKRLFTDSEADKLNSLMDQIYYLKDFDPCGYIITLDSDYWIVLGMPTINFN